MARSATPQRKIVTTAAAWTVALIIFFPIYWTILTSFKTEAHLVETETLGCFKTETQISKSNHCEKYKQRNEYKNNAT